MWRLTKLALLFSLLSLAFSASHKVSNYIPEGKKSVPEVISEDKLNHNGKEDSLGLRDGTIISGNIEFETKNLNNGYTRGAVMTSHGGRFIYAFQGIPYVNQPQRYKRALAVKSDYDRQLTAINLGRQCLQASAITIGEEPIATGDEDCLFINVYTPTDTTASNVLLPVMVYIHGGQFVHGDASTYMPIRLLDEDVVLVTFQYRLGALSFYSFGSDGSRPGNLALHDQHIALKWVNMYIEDFGGKNTEVTLFGQDAGSTSAMYQLITDSNHYTDEDDKEITLFHAVIAQSGSPLDPFGFDKDGEQTSRDLEAAVGCTENDWNCMIDLPENEIALAAYKLSTSNKREISYSIMAPKQDSMNGFVKKAPLDLMLEGNYQKLPLMLGTCAQEGSYVFGELYSHYLAPQDKLTDEEYLKYDMVPDLVQLAGIYDPLEFVSSSLYETYLDGVDRTQLSDITTGMIDMSGSLFSKAGILETAKLSYENYLVDGVGGTQTNAADIFLYSFEYNGADSMFPYLFWGVKDKPNFTEEQIGVTHGDELLYLLTMSSLVDKDDEKTMERMVKMWASFATEHKPTTVSGGLGVTWSAYSNQKQEYLRIAQELEPMEGYEDRYTLLVDSVQESGGWSWPFTTGTGNFTFPTSPTISIPTLGPEKCSCEELADVEDERQAYMITMIVFIILFCMALGFAIYSYFKSR